jgi:predicted 2-oxoglutarate/Fe(II)-dependent dioxygenase YbiX
MSSITADLASALSSIRRPGEFAISGRTDLFAPKLDVEGVGRIALPLLPVQAEELTALAERAPFGRGQETLVDTDIRRTWQLAADQVQIGGKHWQQTLDHILDKVADGLGVTDPIEAEFYKLLIYDEGSFFVSHRDTEKTEGMFATLVIVLPSPSEGGELVVRHGGREVALDLAVDEPAEAAFAAFYADCVHEVRPVTKGHRLTLIYNLLRKGAALKPHCYDSEQARVTSILRSWTNGRKTPDNEKPKKIIYPLEHAYTPAALGFEALKGSDAGAAGVLAAAARDAEVDLHLALLTIEESGWAEHVFSGGYYDRWHSSDDAFEVGEVTDGYAALSEWRHLDGTLAELGDIPVDDDELSPPGSFDEMEPDEEHFQEATGNEGASFERTYRRAALVLWPEEQFFAVLCQAGLKATLPYLGKMVESWTASGSDPDAPLRSQAQKLAKQMLSSWTVERWYPSDDQGPSDAAKMLTLLAKLEETKLINAFLTIITAGGDYRGSDNDAIIAAVGLLPLEQATAVIGHIIVGNVATSLCSSGNLLLSTVDAFPDGRFDEAGKRLIEAVPGLPKNELSYRDERPTSDFVADLMTALCKIDLGLSDRAADLILGSPKRYRLDGILVPALCRLVGSEAVKSMPVQRLLETCREHLSARIAESLEAPKDWRRANKLKCQCHHCNELSRFLDNPEQKRWAFKAAEAKRSHVTDTIRRSKSDVDLEIDKQGRPYSLVCTKNQNSYDHRVRQRKQDLEDLASLEG